MLRKLSLKLPKNIRAGEEAEIHKGLWERKEESTEAS